MSPKRIKDHSRKQYLCSQTTNQSNSFCTIAPKHKDGNIANFVLAVSFKIKKANKVLQP